MHRNTAELGAYFERQAQLLLYLSRVGDLGDEAAQKRALMAYLHSQGSRSSDAEMQVRLCIDLSDISSSCKICSYPSS
jgi:hypothetical protein